MTDCPTHAQLPALVPEHDDMVFFQDPDRIEIAVALPALKYVIQIIVHPAKLNLGAGRVTARRQLQREDVLLCTCTQTTNPC